MSRLQYLSAYPAQIQQQALELVEQDRLGDWLLQRHPQPHQLRSEKALYEYAMALKNRYLRKTPPLNKVCWDNKLHVIRNALGTHSYVSRVQGGRLKSSNEIRVATLFRSAPEAFLRMILVHELAHFKEKEHNKAFYQLCCHMEPDYHQLELELRLYLTQLELNGPIY
ncbi:M48 metallopeptidase family protein [Marinobacterium arenosum]|uniref:M48 metallopeptidase family protein n=1 Tax=Marinobacterium arenosum TaxID=2862496 RepID=UPI001C9378D0|nr:M48 family metallopeptidase [Marinobacterium arenosum]MBY4676983.1 M48 family metallopeptidase [Marinobacterium arenosum]